MAESLLLCLCALSYTNDLSIYGFNFCSNHNLCAGNAHNFIPSHILILLQFQAIFGDAYHPICQYGKIEMRLDSIVALMIDRTDVQVCLQHMESLYLTNLFIKIAKNRTEKQGKASFLFKILLFLQKKVAARQLKQVS